MFGFLKPTWKKVGLTALLAIISLILFYMMTQVGLTTPWIVLTMFLVLPSMILMQLFYRQPWIYLGAGLIWIYLISCSLYPLLTLIAKWFGKITWNKKTYSVLAGIVLVMFVSWGFFSLGFGDIFIRTANDDGFTSESLEEIVYANNQFSVDMYKKIVQNETGNLFFSPWSISNAVAMLYEGADGETAEEIQEVFGFPGNDSLRRAAYAHMLNTLNKAGGKYDLKMANALWLHNEYPFVESYKDVISEYYLGEITNLDFGNPTNVAKNINNWAADNTNNKIKQVVDASMFNPLSRAVLTNAIYFKGKWVEQFDRDDTKPRDFTLNSGAKIKTDMMYLHSDEVDFNYAEIDGIQILEMPYQGDKISMLVLLPRTNLSSDPFYNRFKDLPEEFLEEKGFATKELSLEDLESMISADKLNEWRMKLKPEEVAIFMPKFKFETEYDLGEMLQSMGMKLAFDDVNADFSKMGPELYVDKILHKSYIDVYEEGTEAASVTVISMAAMSAMPTYKMFNTNHPFLFILQEKETGNVLFLGKVVNPVG